MATADELETMTLTQEQKVQIADLQARVASLEKGAVVEKAQERRAAAAAAEADEQSAARSSKK